MEEEKKANWLDGIEDRVVEAFRARGLKAVFGAFLPMNGKCCALGALFHDEFAKVDNGQYTVVVQAATGATQMEVWDFIYGFDKYIRGIEDTRQSPERDAARSIVARLNAEGLVAQ